MVETRSGVTSWPGGSSWLWKDVALAYGGEFLVTVEWNTLDTGALIADIRFNGEFVFVHALPAWLRYQHCCKRDEWWASGNYVCYFKPRQVNKALYSVSLRWHRVRRKNVSSCCDHNSISCFV